MRAQVSTNRAGWQMRGESNPSGVFAAGPRPDWIASEWLLTITKS
jgi:hypothetical protein